MKTTDIGFERFPEDFYADPSTAFIKTDLEEYTKIIKSSSAEQRMRFLENKKPHVMEAWERYVKQNKYHYCVNTFKQIDDSPLCPVQLYGDIEAESEEDAIQKLIDNGTVYPRAYEFLELKKWVNGRNLIL